MCVIILRDVGVEIPRDKIISAATTNRHGFGLVAVKPGEIPIVYYPKVVNEKTDNDPDEVFEQLEKHKDRKVLLHLRIRTQGDISLENCHPFISYADVDKNEGIFFAHNGTLNEYKIIGENKKSDSNIFNMQIAAPTIQLLHSSGVPTNKILQHDYFRRIIKATNNYSSVLSFIDHEGNDVTFNADKGKKFDGWWASNEYSFNRSKPAESTSYYYGAQNTNAVYKRTNTEVVKTDKTPLSENICEIQNTHTSQENKSDVLKKEANINISSDDFYSLVGDALLEIETRKRKGDATKQTSLSPARRSTFLGKSKIESLEKLAILELDDIESMCINYPNESALLIADLLYELYVRNHRKDMSIV